MTTPGDSSENPQSEGSAPPPAPPASYPAPPSYSPQGGSHPLRPQPPSYSPPNLGSSSSPGYGSSATRLAYWSLVSSGIGIVTCGIGSVVGIVLGVIALNQINRTNQRGRGLAIAGIAVGVVWTLILLTGLYAHSSGSS